MEIKAALGKNKVWREMLVGLKVDGDPVEVFGDDVRRVRSALSQLVRRGSLEGRYMTRAFKRGDGLEFIKIWRVE